MKKTLIALAAAVGLLSGGALLAQSISVPQVVSIGANDLFQDIV